ncbi:MAG: site-2 protease family protein [Chloroflexi bacterium]|nr:site-2 protease family protein [Chloroflexota bacterium]
MSLSRPPAGWSTSRRGQKKGIAALRGWKLFRFGGTEVYMDASWPIFFVVSFVVTAFFTLPWGWGGAFERWTGGYADLSHWGAGLLAAALILACILAHELAHLWMAKGLSMASPKTRLYVFGDVVEPMCDPREAGDDVTVAIAGPIASAVLGGVCLWLASALPYDSLPQAVLQVAGQFNLFLAVFSLLPGYPLDGGRILREIIEGATGDSYRATRIASRAGMVLSVPIGILGFLSFSTLPGIWALAVAWFLWTSASASNRDASHRQSLGTAQVRVVARPFTQAPFAHDASVEEVWQAILGDRARPPCWPVADVSGEITAWVTRRDLSTVPSNRRSDTRVAEIAHNIEPADVLEPQMLLDAVLTKVRRERRGFYVVKQDGRIAGWVYADDLVQGKRPGGTA